MIKRKRLKKPVSPMCSAPGCPLRYYRALNNGAAYCRYHRGVNSAGDVSEITRNIHRCLPAMKQYKLLNGLNASQRLGREPVEHVEGLPDECCKRSDEMLDEWRLRLQVWLDEEITQRSVA